MIELYIGGKLLDLENLEITQSFQLNDIGEPGSRQTSYTNNIKIPDTPNNRLALKCFSIGATPWWVPGLAAEWKKELPYGVPDCKLVEDGIEIVSNGFAVLSSQDGPYLNVSIYGAEKTFANLIKGVTLKDCFPNRPFTYNAANFLAKMDSDVDYIFGLAYYNQLTLSKPILQAGVTYTETVVTPFQMAPQFYVKDLLAYVFDYLGYTVEYPTMNGVLLTNNPDYTDLVVTASRTAAGATININSTVDIREFCPTTPAYDLLKDIMTRFFLLMEVDEKKKIIRFANMDYILNESQAVDFSKKFDSVKRRIYKLDKYGKLNFYKYSEDVKRIKEGLNRLYDFEGELDGFYPVGNESLENEVDIYESPYKKPSWPPFEYNSAKGEPESIVRVTGQTDKTYPWISLKECDITVNGGNKIVSEIIEEPELQILRRRRIVGNANNHIIKIDFLIQNVSFNVNWYNLVHYIDLKYSAGVKPSGAGDIMSFQKYIDAYYKKASDSLYFYEGFEILLNLNTIDIYRLDFFRRVYIEQLGGLFYLNKVSNYRKGKLTTVEVIRIYPFNFSL